ncbi:MAG: MFS transporter [Nitrososphaerota archaeon]|nr:MFS transporter [Candidatus Calditenuis fumarioli]
MVRYYIVLWTVMLFGWITNYVCRTIVSPALPYIRDEFGVSHELAGLGLMTLMLVGYFSMQLPAGYIGDRYGRKRILVLGPVLWGTATIGTALSPTFAVASATRFLKGLAMGTYFGNDRPVIAHYTPREKMGLGQGISFSGLGIGLGLGMIVGGALVSWLGWRLAVAMAAIPSFVASLLISRVLREPETHTSGRISRAEVIKVFGIRDLWLLNGAAFCALFSLWSVLWLPTVLTERGIEIGWASTLTSLFGFASPVGLVVSGLVSDALTKRGMSLKLWLGASIALQGLFWALFGYALSAGADPWTLAVLVFGAGFWQWGLWSPLYSTIAKLVQPSVLGTAYGLNNFIGQMGGLSPWLIGWVRDVTGSFVPAYYVVGVVALVGGFLAWLTGSSPDRAGQQTGAVQPAG